MLKACEAIYQFEQAFRRKLIADTLIVEMVAPFVFDDDIDKAESACAIINEIKITNNTLRFYMYANPN